MLLQGVRSNIVQAIRAYRVDDLMHWAQESGHHFLHTDLSQTHNKTELVQKVAQDFMFPAHFGENLDALYDCMTDSIFKSGRQQGFIVILEQLPYGLAADREEREQILDIFRDASDYWADRRIPFRCFYSFQ
jgi:RNAse (barnase) inhibitor barstar